MARAVLGAVFSVAAALLVVFAVTLRSRDEPLRAPTQDHVRAREPEAGVVPVPPAPGPTQAETHGVESPAAPTQRRAVGPPLTGHLEVSGFVRRSPHEPDGNKPVPGATVRLVAPGATLHWPDLKVLFPNVYPSARTDERGAFTLAAEVPTSIAPITGELIAEMPGWVPFPGARSTVRIDSVPFEESGLLLYLARPTVLDGQVTDAASGGDVRGARVEWNPPDYVPVVPPLSPNPADSPGRRTATTGEDGRFSLDLGTAKKGSLLVTADGYHAARLEIDPRRALPALTIPLLRLDDLPAIHGVVLGPSGRPGSSARVSLEPVRLVGAGPGGSAETARGLALRDFEQRIRAQEERCAGDGTFLVRVPCGGLWRVAVRLEGLGKEVELHVEPRGTTPFRIALDPPCRLRLRVVDERGAPVTANVCFRRGSALGGSTAQQGILDLGGFAAGEEIRVYAELQGRRSSELAAAFRAPGEVVDLGTLALPPR